MESLEIIINITELHRWQAEDNARFGRVPEDLDSGRLPNKGLPELTPSIDRVAVVAKKNKQKKRFWIFSNQV